MTELSSNNSPHTNNPSSDISEAIIFCESIDSRFDTTNRDSLPSAADIPTITIGIQLALEAFESHLEDAISACKHGDPTRLIEAVDGLNCNYQHLWANAVKPMKALLRFQVLGKSKSQLKEVRGNG